MFTRIKTLYFLRFLFPGVVLVTLGLTALAYILVDLFPTPSDVLFTSVQVRILTKLWAALVWGLYMISTGFLIYHQLGRKQGLIHSTLPKFVAQNFSEYITAQLRVLVHVGLWSLALIIPGVIIDARFRLTSLFIFFHPRFHQDRTLDPLRLSLEAIPLKKVGVISIMVLLTTIMPLVMDSVFPHANLRYEPQGRVAQIFVYALLNVISCSYIFKIYLDVTEGKEDV